MLAFEGLPPSEQAKLFIDINAEQKAVKQSLLIELYAELHWDAKEPAIRVRAVVSKAIQTLESEPDSPFYQRILMSDSDKNLIRCISITSLSRALDKPGFYIVTEKKGTVLEFGPLWESGSNEATRKRTVFILKNWFNIIRSSAPDWWDAGSGEGGGLAMNDGVAACMNVLRSVFQHLDATGNKLILLNDEALLKQLQPYAEILGNHLASLSPEERKDFRDLRGVQGQLTRTHRCQQAIHRALPSFNPSGLKEFIETEQANTSSQAKVMIERIEKVLQKTVIEELQREFGGDESKWWTLGVPKSVRVKVTTRFEEENGEQGGRECYFDLADYKQIAVDNWDIFEPLLAYGKTGNKDKRISWISEVNEMKRLVSNSSGSVSISFEQLNKLEQYDQWLSTQIAGGDNTGVNQL